MRNPLIHKGFFGEMFRQLRAKGLVMTFVMAGLNLITFSTLLTRGKFDALPANIDPRAMAAPMLIMLYIMVPVMVFGAYRWLNKRSESDFYHAIPLSRTQVYASTTAAILLWIVIALGSFAAVHAIMRAAFGVPFNYVLYLCVLINMLLASLEIVAAFSIGSALCGRRFAAFFQSLTVLFVPRIFLTAFWILLEADSGVTDPFSLLPFFVNPEFNIAATPIHSLAYGINWANILAMLWSLVYGCGLLVLGCLAFHRRKSETAEIPYASRVLQTITRVSVGLVPLALIVLILNMYVAYGKDQEFLPFTIALPLIVSAVIFSFLFYCLYELISSKKMKKVVKAMPSFGFCILAALFFVFVPNWLSDLKKPMPVRAEDIRSYTFNSESTLIVPSNIIGIQTYPQYVLTHHTFHDEDTEKRIAARSEEICRHVEKGSIEVLDSFMRVIVNDGGLFRKSVGLNGAYSDNDKILNPSTDEASFENELCAYPKGMIWYTCQGLTDAEAREVGRLFREDYEKLNNEQRRSLMNTSLNVLNPNIVTVTGSKEPQVCDLTITLTISHGADNMYMSYIVNELTPNAAKAMLGYLNERYSEMVRRELKETVEWMEHPNRTGAFHVISVGNYTLQKWYLSNTSDEKTYNTPKEAHPEIYQILKALSEAPIADDPSNAVTVTGDNYYISDILSVNFNIDQSAYAKAGFAVDAKLMEIIRQFVREQETFEYDGLMTYESF